ncbi:peptidoglycan DD-metalloendopeptidase family protein [Mucilaginibacter terrae]|uniref:Murein DD-endopeptidase MepM/ murein hydrolase activator NlpD n=1 Tax=Mucilaginibacter terrae TaxID=1955052 RepID=A0ABU3GZ36_9SPHI|nr:peptidoglycan DD-metalloendopeptidase family protein [Mucilaginibacter terrae]MDT3403940.1 murein DD-endopeptidase MepM/ murein hydrolase activator NlpD [Mucilaginibacter terrae]
MDKHQQLINYVASHKAANVVDIDREYDRLFQFDFTANNTQLSPDVIADTHKFSAWVDDRLTANNCIYGIGGYMEHRTLYARSAIFNTATEEPRRLHLGVDIWGPAGTPVYSPYSATVHSFQHNAAFGDYGPTIILQHNLDGLTLYSLYGHLNTESLYDLYEGMVVEQGRQIASFGTETVNGNWPPHLHFQLMYNMQGLQGDYPGVCRFSEKDVYQQNIPDPEIILQFNHATII